MERNRGDAGYAAPHRERNNRRPEPRQRQQEEEDDDDDISIEVKGNGLRNCLIGRYFCI